MLPKKADRERVLEELEHRGGLREGTVEEVHRATGVPAADIYGVATFYHLLAEPEAGIRVCQGLSCKLAGCDALMADLAADGRAATFASCLGRCDMAPAMWEPASEPAIPQPAIVPSSEDLAIDLAGSEDDTYEALEIALGHKADWILDELASSGLTGRGGAGFPAHVKWRAVRQQSEAERYVVLNADEGEPGTFKDREVILRRPHLVVEGLAIAARCLEAQYIYCYVRGEFGRVKFALEQALKAARSRGVLDEAIRWHFVDGHGAYICGEETALLEALEGKRGMPRMKPPYPVEKGFRGKPTLIQNVETIACVPAILRRGGEWFKSLGATEAGTKLYCMSGHVHRPGVYEAPMGTRFTDLLEMAGGVADGELKAFSPGGASSGFLSAAQRDIPMDFESLRKAGSMLGSAGVVVLNDSVDMVDAALTQMVFFEDESCGQCSPCRIGTQIIRQALERYRSGDNDALRFIDEVAWGMREASICGLGQAASIPLTSAIQYFPEEFGLARPGGKA